MSEPQPVPPYRVENPSEAFERMRAGVKRALNVSKPEILRREAEAKEQRKTERRKRGEDS